MMHTKFQDHRTLGSGEKDFLTIYRHGGHLGHVIKIIFISLCPPPPQFQRRLNIKFGFDWPPSGFREEDVPTLPKEAPDKTKFLNGKFSFIKRYLPHNNLCFTLLLPQKKRTDLHGTLIANWHEMTRYQLPEGRETNLTRSRDSFATSEKIPTTIIKRQL